MARAATENETEAKERRVEARVGSWNRLGLRDTDLYTVKGSMGRDGRFWRCSSYTSQISSRAFQV